MRSNDLWITIGYDAFAVVGALLSIYVMQKTEHDRINKIDPHWLKSLRRMWFVVLALVLCYTVLDRTWEPSIPILLLTAVGVGNLAINALALHLRVPPDGKSKIATSMRSESPRWDLMRQAFIEHRNEEFHK